jgi:hypothetical protein
MDGSLYAIQFCLKDGLKHFSSDAMIKISPLLAG